MLQAIRNRNPEVSNYESITSQVYTCIRDGEFSKAIKIFESKLGYVTKTRATLSLLAYCCYMDKDYARAADFYEELVALCPNVDEYQLYYVQSLVMMGAYQNAYFAAKALLGKNSEHSQSLRLLLAQSEMELDMLPQCKKTLSKCSEDEPAIIIALAVADYNDEKFSSAVEKFKIARQMMGDTPMLLYYTALCRHKLSDNDEALDEVTALIESSGILGKSSKDFEEAHLKTSFIVEALNLKTVILSDMERSDEARDTMTQLHELVHEEHLDAISIHNAIISSVEADPFGTMQSLSHLLSDASHPLETLVNLLLLCIKHGEYDLALKTFEVNKLVAKRLLTPELFVYIESAVLSISSPTDAFYVLKDLVADMTPKLKEAQKKLNTTEASSTITTSRPSTTSLRPATASILATSQIDAKREFDSLLQTFIPVLMLQTKLLWDEKEYSQAEQLLLEHSEYCIDNDDWNLNLAHILFVQRNGKLEESIPYYEHVVHQWAESEQLLKAPAVAIANLCVAYIMTDQNESAEAIMKAVESEEEQQYGLELDASKSTYHTCLINLVIGTLYCEKGKYEFGISRICKSLEPLEKNLCVDTWFYSKKCFLAVASKISKLMIVLENDTMCDIIDFLKDVELHGKNISIDDHEEIATDAVKFDQSNISLP